MTIASGAARWADDPVVVTVAPTGAEVTRANNPGVPYSTQEVASSAVECAEAGASVVHLHVREDDGTPSARGELFEDVIRRIRAGSELVTMVSTAGLIEMSIAERAVGLDALPDLAGVESGSMNFGDGTFITSPADGRDIIDRATRSGIGLEVEAFDVGHVVAAVRWLESGTLPAPLRINLVFGVPGGIDASPQALQAMLRPLPPDAVWTVTRVGRNHFRMLAAALLSGASEIRTGFEDVVHLDAASWCRRTRPWSRPPSI